MAEVGVTGVQGGVVDGVIVDKYLVKARCSTGVPGATSSSPTPPPG